MACPNPSDPKLSTLDLNDSFTFLAFKIATVASAGFRVGSPQWMQLAATAKSVMYQAGERALQWGPEESFLLNPEGKSDPTLYMTTYGLWQPQAKLACSLLGNVLTYGSSTSKPWLDNVKGFFDETPWKFLWARGFQNEFLQCGCDPTGPGVVIPTTRVLKQPPKKWPTGPKPPPKSGEPGGPPAPTAGGASTFAWILLLGGLGLGAYLLWPRRRAA